MNNMEEVPDYSKEDIEIFQKILTSMGMDPNNLPTDESSLQILADKFSALKANDSKVNLPGGKAFLGSQGLEEQVKGKYITPNPGFCLKTRYTNESVKVFVNICFHEDIAVPAPKKKLDDTGNEVEGMNIPMSVGPLRNGKDKSDKDCIIIDIIMNPKVLEDVREDSVGTYRDFVCQLALQYLEQKYKKPLDRRYKLPKLKYLGEVEKQYIQDRKSMPVIEEIESSTSSYSQKKTTSKSSKVMVPVEIPIEDIQLPYKIVWVETVRSGSEDSSKEEEKNNDLPIEMILDNTYIEPTYSPPEAVNAIALIASLESAPTLEVKDVGVQLSPFKFMVKVPGYKAVNVYLPCAVQPLSASCLLSRPPGSLRKVSLRLSVNLDTEPWEKAPDPGSTPWLMAQALSDDKPYHVATNADRAEVKQEKTLASEEVKDDDVLPEDRFHTKDPGSSWIIQQRDQAVKDKWAKHEKEKEERKNDPNVEYVEVEDYKPGGKYGPPIAQTSSVSSPSQLMASSVKDPILSAASGVIASLAADKVLSVNTSSMSLSSTLWSELL